MCRPTSLDVGGLIGSDRAAVCRRPRPDATLDRVVRPRDDQGNALSLRPQEQEQERLLRQTAVALRAGPRIIAFTLGGLVRRSVAVRAGVVMALAATLGVGSFIPIQTFRVSANDPSPILSLTPAAFTTRFSTDHGLTEPVAIDFSSSMDRASVAASLSVEPLAPVSLRWDATSTVLTIRPMTHWSAGVFHAVTVRSGALAVSGQPLTRPARAVFLTRDSASGSVVPTRPIGTRISIDSAFLISFDRQVDHATVLHAIRLDPPVPGAVEAIRPADGPPRYQFVPASPLAPDMEYRVTVEGVRDLDGALLAPLSLTAWTTKAPDVVKFRPRADASGVGIDGVISVRFTQAMDQRSTARAFSVSSGGKPIAGTSRWAESDTVLVFTPRSALPFGSKVRMRVGAEARDTLGVAVGRAIHETFRTVRRSGTSASTGVRMTSIPRGGGGSVGGGTWAAVETYYLGLMNCTRTGGWVTSDGSCSSPGGRDVAPLRLDPGISSGVSRPYARRIAMSGDCSHFIGGGPADRLRKAGYTSYRWAENIGCRGGGAFASVLGTHRFFQDEKSTNGGHWVNMMNPAYDRVGIGVWVSGGRVRLVIDFYHS